MCVCVYFSVNVNELVRKKQQNEEYALGNVLAAASASRPLNNSSYLKMNSCRFGSSEKVNESRTFCADACKETGYIFYLQYIWLRENEFDKRLNIQSILEIFINQKLQKSAGSNFSTVWKQSLTWRRYKRSKGIIIVNRVHPLETWSLCTSQTVHPTDQHHHP